MKELANYLKSEREQRGLTLKAISERARISMVMLQSLEAGDFESIGTALHIRNFIRAYCSALGIDHVPILEKYDAQIIACDGQDDGIKRYGVLVKSLRKRRFIGKIPVFLVTIAFLGGVYGGAWVWKWRERYQASQNVATDVNPQQELPPDLPEKGNSGTAKDARRISPERDGKGGAVTLESSPQEARNSEAPSPGSVRPHESPSAKSAAVGNSPTEVLQDDHDQTAAVSREVLKHRFAVDADQETWVQVIIDNKKTEQVLLQPGEKREWEAEEGIQIVVGNAGGVKMKWDGEPLEVPAKSGGVLRFQLPDPRYMKAQQRT